MALTDAIPLRCLLLQYRMASATLVYRTLCAGAPPLKMLLRHGPDHNNAPDRRAMRRFSMKLPAAVRVSGIPSPFLTETVNVSARGIFFYIERWMKEGSQVEVTMAFPSQVTLAEPLQVRVLARVVRVEPEVGTWMGVAAAIEEYEFLRPEEEGSAGLKPVWSFVS
jgi:PilZ domain